MTNLQQAVKAYRWNNQVESADFAVELGLTTREYNRFEKGESTDTDTLMAVMRWLFAPQQEPKAQAALPLTEPAA